MSNRFTVILLVLALVGIAVSQMNFSPQAIAPQDKFRDAIKQKTGKPTLVVEGAMSEKQKKHSKRFKGFGVVTRGKKLRDLTSEQGDVVVIYPVGSGGYMMNFDLRKYLY